MKKTFRLLSLFICTLLIFSLASCGGKDYSDETKTQETVTKEEPFEPKDAVSLWNKIDETMDQLVSYESSSSSKITYYYFGNRFDVSSTAASIFSENLIYTEAENVIACEALSVNETMHFIEAYYDGKMYISNKDSTYDQKFCSAMTLEEYQEAGEQDLLADVDLLDCTKSEFSQNEDGSWNLKFFGYTKKAITALMKHAEMTDDLLGATILDMEVNIVASPEFYANKIEIVFSFDVDENSTTAPSFSVQSEFSKFNQANAEPEKLKPDEYTVVEDVRILDDVADGITAIQNANNGKATLDITSNVKLFGQEEKTIEKDTISWGKKNGAYFYDIAAETNANVVAIRFENGVQTITVGKETQTVSQSEDDAKMFLDDLINSAKYQKEAVTSIEKTGDGIYLLKVATFDVSQLASAVDGMGIELSAGNQEIVVTMVDGTIQKIESKITMTGVYRYGNLTESVSILLDSTLSVEQLQEGSQIA